MAKKNPNRVIDLVKLSRKRLNETSLEGGMNKIMARAVGGNRAARGWTVKVGADDWMLPFDLGEDGYKYLCPLVFECKPKKTRSPEAIEQDWQNIIKLVTKAANSPGWSVDAVNGNEPEEKAPSQSVAYVPIEIPIGWRKYVNHIYDRDPQIDIIMSAVKAGVATDFHDRFHCALIGEPACISGDAMIGINRAGLSKQISLEKLYKRFNGIKIGGRGGYLDWDQKIPTAIRCRTGDGKIRLKRIKSVISKGFKSVYEVETLSGYSVKATIDHEFLTLTDGWQTLGWLMDNLHTARICVLDPLKMSGKKHKRNKYRELSGLINHPFPSRPERATVRIHRLMVEAEMNDMAFEDFVKVMRNPDIDRRSLASMKFLDPDSVVHHKNEDSIDNRRENLFEMDERSEHSKMHGVEKAWAYVTDGSKFDAIVSIGKPHRMDVYDISLYDEPHNFLANNIVVHNCGKSETLKGFMSAFGDAAVIQYDATAMTQAGVIKDLNERDELPRILIVEEIEKTNEESLRWLLGVMDIRAEIRKTNYRENIQKETKLLTLATVNNYALFKRIMSGALASRFSHHIYFPRPNRDLLERILTREIERTGGKKTWIKPVLEYAEEFKLHDPRKLIAICLCGRDDLLSGRYQEKLRSCSIDQIAEEE